jgi:hypothetical protein
MLFVAEDRTLAAGLQAAIFTLRNFPAPGFMIQKK